MRRKNQPLLCLTLLMLFAPAAHASLAVSTSAYASSGEGGYGSAIIDNVGGFAHFGSSSTYFLIPFNSTYSYITPVALSPFSVDTGISYFPQVTNLSAAAFDTGTRYGYFVSSQAPSVVQLIPYGGGVPISSITLASGQDWVGTAVIDSENHFAYLGTGTSPSVVIKLRLPDGVSVTSMTIVSTITLPSGLEYLSASVLDARRGFAYFGSSTTIGAVAKIKLSDFSLVGTLTFNSGEGGVASAVIDVPRHFAYFATHDSPGKIVEVNLSNFSRSDVLTLETGQNDLTSAVADIDRGFAYFGTNTSTGIVIPVRLSNLSAGTSLTLDAGDNDLRSAVIDTANGYAYFGTYTTPGKVIQVDLLAGLPVIEVQPTRVDVHAGDNAAFAVVADGRALTYQWYRNGVAIAGATSAGYSFVAAVEDDGATFYCQVTGANGTTASASAELTIIPLIRVFPNPWRSDRHTGNITFDGLLANSIVKVYTLSAHWVRTLPPATGSVTWDRTNDAGELVASGYYFYLVMGRNDRQTVHGKLAIIR